ncbi:hypothetical protein RJ639_001352 [Escallonia herrerae]|uniref:Calcium-transporting ATPase n=1 Tax=Escallonia herrerae TaxID=1293975 RepID=A0AA88X910_9ASTE|nr:hypothetical protein RJ639_001352 [Escallonia herrerae]
MSLLSQANLDYLDSLPDSPITLSELNKKRWHMAFGFVYCSRALLAHFKASVARKKSKVSPVASSRLVAIDVLEPHPCFPTVDQSSLTQLVKGKHLDQLAKFDGVEGVASALKTNVESGIHASDEDILRRQEAFGRNTYQKPPTKGFFRFVWEALKDPTILILMVCAGLSLGFGMKEDGPKEGWYDGGSVFVAVFLLVSVSAISKFRQNRQFDKLSNMSNNIQVEVVRDGRRQHVSVCGIVVGDVIYLKIGDQVPTDGLFLDGHSLQVDESSMTSESDHVEVNRAHNPFLFSGTKVADGYARLLVTSVGMNTMWGEMMSTLSRDTDEQTPLRARLNKLTSSIGKVGLAVAFLVLLVWKALLVLLIRYFTGNTEDENGNTEFNASKTKVDDIINAVVGIVAAAVTIVVAIPEGLPLAVTLTLAYSMKRMIAVRKLSACETMGSATTICTDKTGTLTLNQMKVAKFWLGQESMEGRSSTSIKENVLEFLHQGVGLDTTGSVYRPTSGSDIEFSGSPTEKAILSWAVLELNMDMEKMKEGCRILHVEAFNSEKKRSGVLMKKNADDTVHVHWKGAAEMILAMCSHYYDPTGEMMALDDTERSRFDRLIQGMAASSLRCIAFAHKQVQETTEEEKIDDKCLTLGLVGLKDPCRPGVKKAVEDCQYAGVNIKMITGDNVFTARAIATECGILKPNEGMNSVSAGEVPLTAVQLLWVNLIMDTLGALALSTERPTKELMNKKPVGRTAPLITNIMWRNLLAQTLYQIAVLLTLQFGGEEIFGVNAKVRDTLIFNTFVLCQVFNEFNARKLEKKNVFEGIHKNKLFLGIIGITVILQVVMVEFLKKLADTERLNWGQWGVCIGLAAVSWPLGWLVKHVPVPETPFFSLLKWQKLKYMYRR